MYTHIHNFSRLSSQSLLAIPLFWVIHDSVESVIGLKGRMSHRGLTRWPLFGVWASVKNDLDLFNSVTKLCSIPEWSLFFLFAVKFCFHISISYLVRICQFVHVKVQANLQEFYCFCFEIYWWFWTVKWWYGFWAAGQCRKRWRIRWIKATDPKAHNFIQRGCSGSRNRSPWISETFIKGFCRNQDVGRKTGCWHIALRCTLTTISGYRNRETWRNERYEHGIVFFAQASNWSLKMLIMDSQSSRSRPQYIYYLAIRVGFVN